MGVGAIVLLVVGILLLVGLLQAAIWIPVTRSWRRKREAFEVAFAADLAASGERIVRGPSSGVYRGATAHYGVVVGNGTIWLTDRRLVFHKRSGGVVEVPVARIVGTHQAKSFNGGRVGGQTHLVVSTSDPAEVGFFVDDDQGWATAIAAARAG